MGYINSLRGSASKEIDIDEVWKQVTKSDDNAVMIVGFFNAESDAAFETYDEASKMLFGLIYFYLYLQLHVRTIKRGAVFA